MELLDNIIRWAMSIPLSMGCRDIQLCSVEYVSVHRLATHHPRKFWTHAGPLQQTVTEMVTSSRL